MDKSDKLLLVAMRKDSRQTLTQISKTTRVPISTIYDKLRMFTKLHVKRYTSLVDFASLGFNTQATIIVKVKKDKRNELRSHLLGDQNVNCLYKINNGFDFMFEAVFPHLRDMEEFLDELEDKFPITGTQVYYIIEDIARERFMSDPILHGGGRPSG